MTAASRLGPALAIAGIVAALAAMYPIASRPLAPLDAGDVARASRQLASLARESALLADAVLQDKATGAFARTHLDKIAEETGDQLESLERSFAPDVRLQGDAVRTHGEDLRTLLRDLKRHLSEGPALQGAAQKSRALATEIAALEPKP